MIVGSESGINAISSRLCENLELKAALHPQPFKVSWIDSTAPEVKQRCLVQVNFNHYKDKIWNVSQVILGRSWLFDKNVTIYGRSNMCQFEHESKQIKLLPLRPKTGQPKQASSLALLLTHFLHLSLLLFLLSYLPLVMYTLSANRFLPYCRHYLTIKHSVYICICITRAQTTQKDQ